jgi:hypothetical protein
VVGDGSGIAGADEISLLMPMGVNTLRGSRHFKGSGESGIEGSASMGAGTITGALTDATETLASSGATEAGSAVRGELATLLDSTTATKPVSCASITVEALCSMS